MMSGRRWRAPTWLPCARKPSFRHVQADVALAEALLKLAGSQKAAGTGTGIEITRAERAARQPEAAPARRAERPHQRCTCSSSG